MRALLAIITAALLCAPVHAQDAEQLESLTRAEAEARANQKEIDARRKRVTRELRSLRDELSKATRETLAFEREGKRLENEVAEIEAKLSDLEADLSDNRARTQDLLAALQRLQIAPAPAIAADPDDAVASAQAALLIDTLSNELQRRADRLRRLTEQLRATREDAAARRLELDANAGELVRKRERTRALVAEKEALRATIETQADKAAAEVARLAAESANLRELIERLQAPPVAAIPRVKPTAPPPPVNLPDGTAPFADAKGALVKPVSGRMVRGFGRGENGQTYAAPADGQVVAPYAGRVEFAGPFRNYGRVVILNMDDGYFLLLTGLGQTYVATNETIARGDPLGQMPGGADGSLYLELRKDGRTIDPKPWLG